MNTALFAERVRACERKLYYTARCMLSSEADCEDAVQEALFKAWRHIGSLRDEKYFETWLTRILINACKTILRNKARRAETALDDNLPAPRADEDANIRRALGKIDVKYRLPLILHHSEGFSIADVARMLNLPKSAVKWRVSKAKKMLGETLRDEEAVT